MRSVIGGLIVIATFVTILSTATIAKADSVLNSSYSGSVLMGGVDPSVPPLTQNYSNAVSPTQLYITDHTNGSASSNNSSSQITVNSSLSNPAGRFPVEDEPFHSISSAGQVYNINISTNGNGTPLYISFNYNLTASACHDSEAQVKFQYNNFQPSLDAFNYDGQSLSLSGSYSGQVTDDTLTILASVQLDLNTWWPLDPNATSGTVDITNIQFSDHPFTTTVPEPCTIWFLALSLVGLIGLKGKYL